MKNKHFRLLGIALAALTIPFCASCDLKKDDGKMSIVATIFPEYDWVMNVLGEKKDDAKVTLLLDSGVDLHSYQPTPKDIVTVSKCDLFIYVGGESDEWVEDVLKTATNKDIKTINLMETLGDAVKEEEIIEGMEGEDHDHDHEEGEDHDHEEGEEHDHEEEEEVEYDEHVWLSLKNAQVLVNEISKALGEIDADNAETYKANAATYVNSLKDLDARYAQAVAAGTKDTLVFADRFPFRYLVDDYNLKYYAAFVGCSAETKASFETIVFLADKVDTLGLTTILKIESSDGSIANTVKSSTTNKNQQILTMDSIQSATTKEYKEGRTYLSIMEQNLTVLKEAVK